MTMQMTAPPVAAQTGNGKLETLAPSAQLLNLCRKYIEIVDCGDETRQGDERSVAHDEMMRQMEDEGIPFNARWEARWMARYLLAKHAQQLPELQEGTHTALMWAKIPRSMDPQRFNPLADGVTVLSAAPFRTEQDEREHFMEWVPVTVTITPAAMYEGVTFWRADA